MKVRSRHNSRENRQKRIAQVFFVALGLILVGLISPYLITIVARTMMYPIVATQQWFHTSEARLPMYLREQTDLISQISDLESRLAAAESTDLTQQRLYNENQWLRGLLSIKQDDRIGAAVIARPNELPYDLLEIDRGAEDGIKVGAPVYIGADNVVGVVSQTAAHYSFVELFTTPGFITTSYISGANVVADLEGFGGGVARVRVPQGIPLRVGDLVHVPSIDPGVFGRITHIENHPTQPDQYGFISLERPISSIGYVAVGKESLEPAKPETVEERISNIIKQSLQFDATRLHLASSTAIIASLTATTTNQP
jgi:cell shape-determining protein MreC